MNEEARRRRRKVEDRRAEGEPPDDEEDDSPRQYSILQSLKTIERRAIGSSVGRAASL